MTERRIDVNRLGHRKPSAPRPASRGASSLKRPLTAHANLPASKRARVDDRVRQDEADGTGRQRKVTLRAAAPQPQPRRRPTVPPTKQQHRDEEAFSSDPSSLYYSSDSSTPAKKRKPVVQQKPAGQQLDEYGFELRRLTITDRRLPSTLTLLLGDISRCMDGFRIISLSRKVRSTFPHYSNLHHRGRSAC